MKRLILLLQFILFVLVSVFAQSNVYVDDIYLLPKDGNVKASTKVVKPNKNKQSAIYRNGAREIVFVDKEGNQVVAVSDTVYVIDGEVIADSLYVEEFDAETEGYYLNGFQGSQSDFEYAERIRRFHNPRYTITIADPDFNDIYFLDDDYWNVYVDGMYATITPTWSNPYYWDYQFSSFNYNSWAWRYNWGYPYYGWGMHNMYSWGYPYYGGYYGGYFGGYYGWGNPYYGWGYPHYAWGYGGTWYQTETQTARRHQGAGRQVLDTRSTAGRGQLSGIGGQSSRSNANTVVSRQPLNSSRDSRATAASTLRSTTNRTGVSTSLRTGAVRSSAEWSNVRSNSERISSATTNTITNRSNPRVSSSSVNNNVNTSRSSVDTRNSSSTSRSIYNGATSTRSSVNSSSTYSTPTRSSSSSVSSGGASRSSGGSMGGGASRSSGGGRR